MPFEISLDGGGTLFWVQILVMLLFLARGKCRTLSIAVLQCLLQTLLGESCHGNTHDKENKVIIKRKGGF